MLFSVRARRTATGWCAGPVGSTRLPVLCRVPTSPPSSASSKSSRQSLYKADPGAEREADQVSKTQAVWFCLSLLLTSSFYMPCLLDSRSQGSAGANPRCDRLTPCSSHIVVCFLSLKLRLRLVDNIKKTNKTNKTLQFFLTICYNLVQNNNNNTLINYGFWLGNSPVSCVTLPAWSTGWL